jgi:hypothetical protein
VCSRCGSYWLTVEKSFIVDNMDSQENRARVRVLAEEYVMLVEQMRSGQYDGDEEYRVLSGQRTLVHDELLLLTGRTREDTDMYAYARAIVAGEAVPPPDGRQGRGGHGHG